MKKNDPCFVWGDVLPLCLLTFTITNTSYLSRRSKRFICGDIRLLALTFIPTLPLGRARDFPPGKLNIGRWEGGECGEIGCIRPLPKSQIQSIITHKLSMTSAYSLFSGDTFRASIEAIWNISKWYQDSVGADSTSKLMISILNEMNPPYRFSNNL